MQLVVRNAAGHVPHRSGPAARACGSRFVPWRACSDAARNAAASTRSWPAPATGTAARSSSEASPVSARCPSARRHTGNAVSACARRTVHCGPAQPTRSRPVMADMQVDTLGQRGPFCAEAAAWPASRTDAPNGGSCMHGPRAAVALSEQLRRWLRCCSAQHSSVWQGPGAAGGQSLPHGGSSRWQGNVMPAPARDRTPRGLTVARSAVRQVPGGSGRGTAGHRLPDHVDPGSGRPPRGAVHHLSRR